MPFAAAISQHPLATHATGEVVGSILEQLGPEPDAAIVFVTAPFAGAVEDIAAAIRSTLRPGALVGTTASAVLGAGELVEGQAAVALLAMAFDGDRADEAAPAAVRLEAERVDDGWRVSSSGGLDVPGAQVVLLADPFSFPVEAFVDDLAARVPGVTVVGGLASAGTGQGGNRFVADERVVDAGAVALVLPPGPPSRAVVSQGCRPLGSPRTVTRAVGNLIDEIAGTPALDAVMALADEVADDDRQRMGTGLHLGVAADEHRLDFERDDFLIRTVLGADHERRAVAVGVEVPVGATVQFHVRDGHTAEEDLRLLLVDALAELPARDAGLGVATQAALVFTCTGRGANLFDDPALDAQVVDELVPGHASVGMACSGEVGPIAGAHHVHAMTASVLVLADGG